MIWLISIFTYTKFNAIIYNLFYIYFKVIHIYLFNILNFLLMKNKLFICSSQSRARIKMYLYVCFLGSAFVTRVEKRW